MPTHPVPFVWEEFIDLSKELRQYSLPNSRYQNALYRAIVSRAYYGAYMYARRRAEKIRGNFSGAKIHEQVIEYYINSDTKKHRKAGSYLKVLKDKRVECDYFDVLTEDPMNMADTSIELAEGIINLIL
jgi:hypothetical protein